MVTMVLFGVTATSGFMVSPLPLPRVSRVQQITDQREILFQGGSRRVAQHRAVIDSSSITVSAESWRQYVPLVVSVGIIVDILLGSPLANAVLKPMRPEEDIDKEEKGTKSADNKPRSKARIDAELVAQKALDKANATLELRNFLDERKTDYDRFEEMKRKLDASMQDLDEDMEARQKAIDETKTN